jgi:hypothetical protein
MKFLKLFIFPFLFLSFAQAQQKPQLYTTQSPFERYNHNLITFRISGAQPVGAFSKDYIDKFSMENYSISLESVRQNNISYGGELGYSFFKKRIPRALYSSDNQDISAVQTRTLSEYLIHAFVNYHLTSSNSMIRPYVQLSAGGSSINYTLYYGTLADQARKFKPGYGLGIGSKFLFKPDGSVGADVRVKYNHTGLNYEYVEKGISSLSASVGIFYRWW